MDKLIHNHWGGRHFFYLITVLLLGSGILFGVLACKVLDTSRLELLEGYYVSYFDTIMPQAAVFSVYQSIIQSNLLDLIKLVFFGLCLIGAPFILILIFTKGFAIGFVAAILLNDAGIKGIAAVFSGIVLPKIIYIPLFISAGAYFLQSSCDLLTGQYHTQRNYWLKSVVRCFFFAVALIAAGCLEGFLIQNIFSEFLSGIF